MYVRESDGFNLRRVGSARCCVHERFVFVFVFFSTQLSNMYGKSAKCIIDEMDSDLIATLKEKTDKWYFKVGCIVHLTFYNMGIVGNLIGDMAISSGFDIQRSGQVFGFN